MYSLFHGKSDGTTVFTSSFIHASSPVDLAGTLYGTGSVLKKQFFNVIVFYALLFTV